MPISAVSAVSAVSSSIALSLALVLTGGCSALSASTPATAVPDAAGAAGGLAGLAVKGRAPKTGYSRAQFGPAWEDVDHNGCDTRNDILARDLADETMRPGSRCVVVTGTLADPYTGRTLTFRKAQASAVQIDHVVALSDAWQTGAQQWDGSRREAFANDPRNLQATDGPTNQQKGDADAASWLPPNTAYRCTYARRQVQVKAAYDLWVTPAERDALARVLAGCP
jgi:hypothetical protein